MRTVRQLLETKSPEVFSVAPDAPVIDAIRLMAEKRIGAVLVMDGARLAGILSERDYARKIMLHGKSSKETLVREIMSDRVAYVTPATTLDECMALMTERHFRHLPVLSEADEVLGIISIGDLVKETISDQQMIISELERYITG